MPTLLDSELLRRYAADRSEDAFAELVSRHVDLVYSAALRQVGGDAHRAEDVSQAVFTELANRAERLIRHPTLPGWLYTTTRLMAAHVRRTEQRGLIREQEAHLMNAIECDPHSEANWEELRPLLDDVMHELDERDRTVVLLRYFKNQSLKEVGDAIGLGDNAARMRVDRALEKLRDALARRGVRTTGTLLAGALSVKAVLAAPSGLVVALTSASLVATGATNASGIGIFASMTSVKITSIAAVLAVIVAGAVAISIYQSDSNKGASLPKTVVASPSLVGSRGTNRFFALPGAGKRAIASTETLPQVVKSSRWEPQKILGQVLDADTGLPLTKFRITLADRPPAIPSQLFPFFESARDFITSNGMFSLEFNLKGTVPLQVNAIEVSADDYSDAIQMMPETNDGVMNFAVKLKPATPLVGTVVTGEGEPVPGVDLMIIDSNEGDITWLAKLAPGHLIYMHPKAPTQNPIHTSDHSAQFSFRSPPENGRIVAACSEGFASIPIGQVRATGRLVLQRYGRVEGVLYVAGEPAVLQELKYSFWNDGIEPHFEGYKTRTDTEGRFVFAMVPPGPGAIQRLTPTSATSWAVRLLTEVTVMPGQTNRLALGNTDAVLWGTVRFESPLPADVEVTTTATISTISSPYPKVPSGMRREEIRAFMQSPEWRGKLNKRRFFTAQVGDDGRFSFDGVPPGDYSLGVKTVRGRQDPVFSQRYGGANATLAQGEGTINVPTNAVPTSPINIGEVVVKSIESQSLK